MGTKVPLLDINKNGFVFITDKTFKNKVKMTSYGKYTPSELVFAELWGREVLVTVPELYSGNLDMEFYNSKGELIKYAESYFEQVAIQNGEYYNTYIKQVESIIGEYCEKIEESCKDKIYHYWQIGFGQQFCNGLIELVIASLIEKPDILFKINDNTYTIKWKYSPTDPNFDEDETYEYD